MNRLLLLIFVLTAMTACTFGKMPMSREEFRTEISKNPKYVETYTANRRFRDVTRIMKKNQRNV